jgi:hypothetical protein
MAKRSVAFLVMYELRCVNRETVKSLYDNIVDVYDADIYILCQKQFDDDAERVALFDRNVVKAELYDPRGDADVVKKIEKWQDHPRTELANFVNDGNVNVYVNNVMFESYLGDLADSYEWFVMSRTDVSILFPFPPKDTLEGLEPGVYCFSPEYCRLWGGSGGGNIVHRDFIRKYLTACGDCLDRAVSGGDPELVRSMVDFNQEKLLEKALALKYISTLRIDTINYFYTAEGIDDRTTWSVIQPHPVHGVLCKYVEQCSEAFENKSKWDGGARWTVVDGSLRIA